MDSITKQREKRNNLTWKRKGTENIEKYEQILGTCGTITKGLNTCVVGLSREDKKWGRKNI